jgi:WD40 repeat protein
MSGRWRLNYTLAQLLLVVVMVANVCGVIVAVREFMREEPTGSVEDVRFSADGQTLVANLNGIEVVTCDAATGKVRSSVRAAREEHWKSLMRSPRLVLAADGNTWAVAYPDGQIDFGQLQPPERRAATMPAFSWGYGPIVIITPLPLPRNIPGNLQSGPTPELIALSDDAAVFAASYAGRPDRDCVVLWDVPSGKILRTLKGQRDVLRVCLTPDGKTLAIERRCHDGPAPFAIDLWDVASGRQRGKTLATYYDGPVCALLAPDNDSLVWMSDGAGIGPPHVTSVRLSTGRKRQFDIPENRGPWDRLAASADGRTLLLANHGGEVISLDAATLVPQGDPRYAWDYHDRLNWQPLTCLACSANGEKIAVGLRAVSDAEPLLRILDLKGNVRHEILLHVTSRGTIITALAANGLLFFLCLWLLLRPVLRRQPRKGPCP